MTELASQILARIKNQYISSLPLDNEMVLPNYEGISLANIPCTVAHLLNAPDFGKPPLDKDITEPLDGPYEKVVVLLVCCWLMHWAMRFSIGCLIRTMIYFGNAIWTKPYSVQSPVFAQVQQPPR